jgi:glycosyltransferase involved in cell wall biosynthesis
MKKIVFVGQTPPPYHGQAIMIDKILAAQYKEVQLLHVRMSFSKEIDEIGGISIFKIFHLLHVIFRIYFFRFFNNARVLYYPPAGPDQVPILRDIVILLSTRWLFQRTIFHFHAGGVSERLPRSWFFSFFYKLAYYKADCAILLSELNPRDGENLKAKHEIIVPYGIEDNYSIGTYEKVETLKVKILFVGAIKESKGVLVLMDACKQLKGKGLDFSVEIMGKFESKEFEKHVTEVVKVSDLERNVSFLGVQSGSPKFSSFNGADIFCFPTFYESETFGVVLLEAMQFSLPVVSTFWRGIPSIVNDGESGFLVKPQDAKELAERLEVLILNPSVRQRMGNAGRKIYLKKFTLSEFQKRMENIFVNC